MVGRWLFFIGLMGIVGIASTCFVALREFPRLATRALGIGWVLASLGVVGIVEAEREAAGVGFGALFSTSLGATAAERIGAMLATGFGAGIALVHRSRGVRVGVAVAGLGAAASMWVDVAASHAGAQAPVAANLVIQWAHIVASAVWIGGLLVLLLGVRGQPSDVKGRAVRRFSTTAGIAIVVVALTGTFRAVIEIGSIDQLFGTAFGILVLVKVALFVALAILGALNRFGNVPKSATCCVGCAELARPRSSSALQSSSLPRRW